MRRTAHLRLTVCIATATVTTVLGVAVAPAASAAARPSGDRPTGAGPSKAVLDHLRYTSSNVFNLMADGIPLGRKLV